MQGGQWCHENKDLVVRERLNKAQNAVIGQGKKRGKSIWGGWLRRSLEINSGPIKFLCIPIDLFVCIVCIKMITLFPDLIQ